MANWATLYSQPSRLPTVPPGSDPREDWFRCERYSANLPRVACANRHRLSKQRTQDGIAFQATLYGGCANCSIGAAHAAGKPTPLLQIAAKSQRGHTSMNDIATTQPNGHAAHAWPDRTCAKCKKRFAPKTARERRCSECTAAARKPATRSKPAAKLAGHRRGGGALASGNIGISLDGGNGSPKSTGVPKPSQIASAAELLELAGYKVQAVHTPAGEFLRVL